MSFIKAVRLADSDGIYRPIEDVPLPDPTDTNPAWARKALQDEVDNVQRATEGTRNRALNVAAFNLGQLTAQGYLNEDTVTTELFNAAMHAGLGQVEATKTIRSALAGGARKPRPAHRLPRATDTPVLHTLDVNTGEITHSDELQPTSWAPRPPLGTVEPEPAPTFLHRTDGTALLYPGKVNGLIGESESGKTWVALLAVVQALNTGHTVLMLDFEDSHAGIVNRLTTMGATDLSKFHYSDPAESYHPGAQHDLAQAITDHHPDLIILDGYNAAMSLMGLDLNSNKDATTFAQTLLKPLSRTGACVVYVDHLPKNTEAQGKGGIGAQAKRAMTTGCTIRVDIIEEFGKGMRGQLKLTVDKDRGGHVRGIAGGGKRIGTATIDSTGNGTTMHIDPDNSDGRPTVLMNRILEYMALVNEPVTQNTIIREVNGRREGVIWACRVLKEEGGITSHPGARGALMYTLPPTGSTGSRLVPGTSPSTGSQTTEGGNRVEPVGDQAEADEPGTGHEWYR